MSIRVFVSWVLIASLAWPSGVRAQDNAGSSTLLIDRGAGGASGATGSASMPTGARSDPFTGAATLRFELRVPPGTGGMQPGLALAYSNQRRADSWVGYGWSLSLGSIRRSLKRGVPTYDDAADRFELDGQELVPDAKTPGRFHTRRESFLRIDRLASGVWEVRANDGRVARFGTSAESRIERAEGQVHEWLLAESEDLRGNGFAVAYDRSDPGTAYPKEVRYTLRRSGERLVPLGGPASERVVRFETEERPDAFQGRIKGLLEEQHRRLARVLVEAGEKLVRRYDLRYEASPDSGRSLLAAVVERGSDAGTDKEPDEGVSQTTRFAYHSNATAKTQGWEEARDWKVPGELVTENLQDGGARIADVNGDGLPDFVIAKSLRAELPDAERALDDPMAQTSSDTGVYLNTGTSFQMAPAPEFPIPATSFFVTAPRGNGPRSSFGTLLADLNGDGRAELLTAPLFFEPDGSAELAIAARPVQIYAANTGHGWQPLTPATRSDDTAPVDPLGPASTASLSRNGDLPGNPSRAFDGNLNLLELDGDGFPDLLGDQLVGRLGQKESFLQRTTFVGRNRGANLGFDFRPSPRSLVLCPDGVGTDFTIGGRCIVEPISSLLFFGEPEGTSPVEVFENSRFGARFLDLDGDGLDDQVRSLVLFGLPGQTGPLFGRRAFLNTGSGFVQDDRWAIPPLADLTNLTQTIPPIRVTMAAEQGVRMLDVNGDGRTDLAQRVQGDDRFTKVWLNSGFPDSAPPQSGVLPEDRVNRRPWLLQPQDSPLQVPSGLAFMDAQGRDLGVRIADLDGNGMPDFIQSRGNKRKVFLNRGSVPDQLIAVANPLGGTTRIEYAASTRFDNTGEDELSDLPQSVQVVSAIQTEDGVGAPGRTGMDYSGGLFDVGDREFRGFARVAIQRPDGRTTLLEFYQDIERAGLMKRSEIRDAQGRVLQEMQLAYTEDDAPGEPFARLLESMTLIEQPAPDGRGEPRRIRTQIAFERDARGAFRFGRVSSRTELGEVDESGRDRDPSDTRTTEVTYVENEALHLVELPQSQIVRGGAVPGSGPVLRESRLFYDGDTSGRAEPTLGLLTRQVAVLGQSGEPDPTTTFAYDEFGNAISVTDPRANAGQGGGSTELEFDSVFHTFMVSSTNALGHVTRFGYEPGKACPDGPPFGSGLLYSEQGPNDTPQTQAVFCHDALGRRTLERGSEGLTEVRTSYVDAPQPVSITRAVLATVDGGVRSSTSAFDGFGRVIRTVTDGPGASAIVQEQTFDALGRMAAQTPPFYAAETRPPATRLAYDALDRVIATERPGEGRVDRFEFDRGTVTAITPTGHRARTLDPFGRVVRVEEFLDGRSLVSTYTYLPTGELASFVDADGNRTSLEYDRLGRRRILDDPDTGRTVDAYDAAGNVTITANAAGEVAFSYDALGRVLERRVAGQSESTRRYDTAPNGIGQLAEQTEAVGTLRIGAYDRLGRPLETVRNADGIAHRFQTRFDPLGQVVERLLPTGRALRFATDTRGYRKSIENAGAPVVQDIEIEADGRPRAWTAANGVRTSFAYEEDTRRLASLEVRGTDPLDARQYSYDASDRITAIADPLDATRQQTFGYDSLDRLLEASGPYAAGFVAQTLHYRYGATGSLLCLDATEAPGSGCPGGRALAYPGGGAGTVRPHAPTSVDGQPVRYAGTGELLQLGERTYGYDALGQLRSAADAGRDVAAFTYDANGSRVKSIENPGPGEIVRFLLSDDFEWNATSATATTYVKIAGQVAAAISEPYKTGAQLSAADPIEIGTSAWLGTLLALSLLLGTAAALAAALALRRNEDAVSFPRGALAAAACWLLLFSTIPGSVWAAPLDGDLNRDGRLDMADALLALRFASGIEQPTPEQLESGDIAPLEEAPQSPSRIDLGDAALLARAAAGEDLDGDGLSTAEELASGESPFRKDTDRDGIPDVSQIGVRNLGFAGSGFSTRPGKGKGKGRSGTGVRGGPAAQSEATPTPALRFFHTDALGSAVVVTDAQGQLVSRIVYRPYGRAVSPAGDAPASVPTFGFTGQRFETSLGIYDYGARFYDPALGRFLQPDSFIPDPTDPQSFNRYAYVRNNPVNRIDPTGNFDLSPSSTPGGDDSAFSATADSPLEEIVATAKRPSSLSERLDLLQIGISGVGVIPALGEIADVANGLISLLRGDFLGAGLDLGSAVPIVGQAIAPASIARRGRRLAKLAGAVDELGIVARGSGEAFEIAAKRVFNAKIIRQNEILRDAVGNVVGEIDFETTEAIVEVGKSLGSKSQQLFKLAEVAEARAKRLDVLFDPTITPLNRLNELKDQLQGKFGNRVRFIPFTE